MEKANFAREAKEIQVTLWKPIISPQRKGILAFILEKNVFFTYKKMF